MTVETEQLYKSTIETNVSEKTALFDQTDNKSGLLYSYGQRWLFLTLLQEWLK